MSLSPSFTYDGSSPGNLNHGDPQCPIATILEELDGSSGITVTSYVKGSQ